MKKSSLAGKRVVITRAVAESDRLARELSQREAIPLVLPLISFEEPEDFGPLDKAISEISEFDWIIFTSVRAVRSVAWRAAELGCSLESFSSRLRVACVGPVTANAARSEGLRVEYVAKTHKGVALAKELGNRLVGAKAFLPRSDRANPDLPTALRHHGAEVREVIAYRTVAASDVDGVMSTEVVNGHADAVLFFSPSAVRNSVKFFGKLSELEDRVTFVAVGPVTAKALQEEGITRTVVAVDTTIASVMEALEAHFSHKESQAGVKS